MTRTRCAALAVVAALAIVGCGGGGDATQSDVQNKVEDTLNEDGYTTPDGVTYTFDEEEATAGADCVSQTMFESDDFTPEERNDVARATNGDEPDPELVAKVEVLVGDCLADLGTIEDS
jgi:hypothetical protein